MTVTPTGVDHVALNVPDVPGAIDFYTNLLGLEIDPERPDFGIAGAWLNAGGQQVHLIELPAPPKMGQHFALLYDDLSAVVAALRAQGVEVADPSPSGPNRLQTFVTDPWGNDVELHQHQHPRP